jgi:hypothetical protein
MVRNVVAEHQSLSQIEFARLAALETLLEQLWSLLYT